MQHPSTRILNQFADAALNQGKEPYDHRRALASFGGQPGEDMHTAALQWAQELPEGYRTLAEYIRTEQPSGAVVARIFIRASRLSLPEEKAA